MSIIEENYEGKVYFIQCDGKRANGFGCRHRSIRFFSREEAEPYGDENGWRQIGTEWFCYVHTVRGEEVDGVDRSAE